MHKTKITRCIVSFLVLAIIVTLSSCFRIYTTPPEKKPSESVSPAVSAVTEGTTETAHQSATITETTSTTDMSDTSDSQNTSNVAAPEPIRLLFVDSINGSVFAGGTLTAGPLLYSEEPVAEPTLNWQWLQCETENGTYVEITGATSNSYKTIPADLNKYICVSVTAAGSAEGSAVSEPVLITKLVLAPLKPVEGFYIIIPGTTQNSPFSGGSGTEADPYIISTADQFMLLQSNTIGTYFKLKNDIDLTEKGTITEKFYGQLDGGNHIVTMKSNTGNGLFYEISAGASIVNLRVTGRNIPLVSVKLESCSKGNLANFNYGTISGCSVEDFIMQIYSGTNVRAGGLIGKNFGVIEECFTTGDLLLNLVQCDAINGYYPSLADDLISDWNKGWGGGLVGVNMNGGIIRNSYSQMAVTVDSPGELTYGISGGLVASNNGDILFCYASGSVTKNKWRGGLVGINTSGASVENSYYDKQSSGREDDDGKGIPKSTDAMKTQSTFVGWSSDIWKFYSDRTDYPKMKWQ